MYPASPSLWSHPYVRAGLSFVVFSFVAMLLLAYGYTTSVGGIAVQRGQIVEVTNFGELQSPRMQINSNRVFSIEIDGVEVISPRTEAGTYVIFTELQTATIRILTGDDIHLSVIDDRHEGQLLRRQDPKVWVPQTILLLLLSFLLALFGVVEARQSRKPM